MSARATSAGKRPWANLLFRELEDLDLLAQRTTEGLHTAQMYYLAAVITRQADAIENGEDEC